MYGKSSELPTSMAAIWLWRQLYVRKQLDEGKSLHTVLSVFAKSLRDEIKTYYQSCLDDDDYPLTRHTEPISDKHGSQVLLNRARAHLG